MYHLRIFQQYKQVCNIFCHFLRAKFFSAKECEWLSLALRCLIKNLNIYGLHMDAVIWEKLPRWVIQYLCGTQRHGKLDGKPSSKVYSKSEYHVHYCLLITILSWAFIGVWFMQHYYFTCASPFKSDQEGSPSCDGIRAPINKLWAEVVKMNLLWFMEENHFNFLMFSISPKQIKVISVIEESAPIFPSARHSKCSKSRVLQLSVILNLHRHWLLIQYPSFVQTMAYLEHNWMKHFFKPNTVFGFICDPLRPFNFTEKSFTVEVTTWIIFSD